MNDEEFLKISHEVAAKEDPHVYLRDFLAWARLRRPLNPKDQLSDQTVEFVAAGIDRFLKGDNPWPQARGNKPKPDIVWLAFHLASGRDSNNPFELASSRRRDSNDPFKDLRKKRHTWPGGLYEAIGKQLKLSAKTVESHERKGKKLCKTLAGRLEYIHWLARYKDGVSN